MPIHNKPSRLRITSKTKSLRLQPKTKNELKQLIEQELRTQGPDADLNLIDTSLITDMSELFWTFDIGNIKIDEWDVSKVTNMQNMFYMCTKFDGNISKWDVSNVTNYYCMFYGCYITNSHRPNFS